MELLNSCPQQGLRSSEAAEFAAQYKLQLTSNTTITKDIDHYVEKILNLQKQQWCTVHAWVISICMRLCNILQICHPGGESGQNDENPKNYGHSARHPCWTIKRRLPDLHLHAQAAPHFNKPCLLVFHHQPREWSFSASEYLANKI